MSIFVAYLEFKFGILCFICQPYESVICQPHILSVSSPSLGPRQHLRCFTEGLGIPQKLLEHCFCTSFVCWWLV